MLWVSLLWLAIGTATHAAPHVPAFTTWYASAVHPAAKAGFAPQDASVATAATDDVGHVRDYVGTVTAWGGYATLRIQRQLFSSPSRCNHGWLGKRPYGGISAQGFSGVCTPVGKICLMVQLTSQGMD